MGNNWDATWSEQTSAPTTPATGKWKLYPKSDGFYAIDDAGTEYGPFSSESVALLSAATELTISAGSVTATQSHHLIDTQADAASDDLDTINGGSDGLLLYIRAAVDTRTVVIKHGTGNIVTPSGGDVSLDSVNIYALLIYDGDNSQWVVLNEDSAATADVTGPGSSTDNALVRWNGTAGTDVQDSGITVDDNDRLTLPDSATYPPLNVTERSAAPSSPSAGDIYLDDGTNTGSGSPGWRRYTGAAWEDITAGAGTGDVTGPGSSTDNAIVRWDGTSGGAVQDSSITIDDSDVLNMADNVLQRPVLKDYGETVNAIGSIGGGTQDIDLTLGNVVTGTVDTSTTTFTFSNPPASGTGGSFTLILTNGGSQTVNWPAAVDWAGGSAPSLTTSGVDVLTFITVDAGTTWYGFTGGLNFS